MVCKVKNDKYVLKEMVKRTTSIRFELFQHLAEKIRLLSKS